VAELDRLIAMLRRGLPEVEPVQAEMTPTAPQVTLADLARSGSISVQRVMVSAPAATLLAGDVLVSVDGRGIAARVVPVDGEATHLASATYVVRVDATRFDPWFVAGAVRPTNDHHTSGRTSGTSGSQRLDLRRYAIPVASLAEQRMYGRMFQQLAEFQQNLGEVAALSATVVREIHAGIVLGLLGPTRRRMAGGGRRRPPPPVGDPGAASTSRSAP
jgi:hypothetical protein